MFTATWWRRISLSKQWYRYQECEHKQLIYTFTINKFIWRTRENTCFRVRLREQQLCRNDPTIRTAPDPIFVWSCSQTATGVSCLKKRFKYLELRTSHPTPVFASADGPHTPTLSGSMTLSLIWGCERFSWSEMDEPLVVRINGNPILFTFFAVLGRAGRFKTRKPEKRVLLLFCKKSYMTQGFSIII